MRICNDESQQLVKERSTMKEDESALLVYLLISLWMLVMRADLGTKKFYIINVNC